MNWQSREDERVARALEGAPLHGHADRRVVALAERIREVPAATGLDAAPEFRAALRARVLAEGTALLPRPRTPAEAMDDAPAADSPSVGGRPPRARHSPGRPPASTRPAAGRSQRRRTAFAAGALVVATLSVTTVAASGDALPGDPLYGLKRTMQGVEIIVARSDVDRGQRHLELARSRVKELDSAGSRIASGPLLSTLDDMDSQTRAGIRLLSSAATGDANEARLRQLAAWTAEQRALLVAASTRLPEAARTRAALSLALLNTVAARIEELRGSLRCDCPPAPPPAVLDPQACPSGCAPVPATSPRPARWSGTRSARAPAAAPRTGWARWPVAPGRARRARRTGSG
ncbi:MAG TPA: DUF5667 domain-containing protein, partial [Mycobacteriales bacterium]|nr:DUF5667 domain-containing protein [Mycobacteriales bacterium]